MNTEYDQLYELVQTQISHFFTRVESVRKLLEPLDLTDKNILKPQKMLDRARALQALSAALREANAFFGRWSHDLEVMASQDPDFAEHSKWFRRDFEKGRAAYQHEQVLVDAQSNAASKARLALEQLDVFAGHYGLVQLSDLPDMIESIDRLINAATGELGDVSEQECQYMTRAHLNAVRERYSGIAQSARKQAARNLGITTPSTAADGLIGQAADRISKLFDRLAIRALQGRYQILPVSRDHVAPAVGAPIVPITEQGRKRVEPSIRPRAERPTHKTGA